MMRRRRRAPIAVIMFAAGFLLVGIVGFVIGYNVYPMRNDINNSVTIDEGEGNLTEDPNNTDPVEKQPDNNTTPVTIVENSVGLDTRIIFRTHYTRCQTIKDDAVESFEAIVGLKEAGFKAYALEEYMDWQVVRFSAEEIILFQRKDQICPDHYYVSENEGYIVVFKFNEAGERYIVERTNIPVSHLPDIDQEKIRRGILVRTREEVNQLLEDYSS